MGAGTSSVAPPLPARPAALEITEIEAPKARAAALRAEAATRASDATARASDATARASDATVRASDATARATDVRTTADVARLLFCLTAVGALIADFYVHESPEYIRRRMMRALRACRMPTAVPAVQPRLLPVLQSPLTLSFVPTMLLGPTGCGKTTLLFEIARKAVWSPVPKPVVLVRIRHSKGRREETSPVSAKVLMDSSVFAQYFLVLDADTKAGLARVLDAIATVDSQGAAGRKRPTKMDLPIGVRDIDISLILSVDRSFRLSFQSQLVAHAWARSRSEYVAQAALLQ